MKKYISIILVSLTCIFTMQAMASFKDHMRTSTPSNNKQDEQKSIKQTLKIITPLVVGKKTGKVAAIMNTDSEKILYGSIKTKKIDAQNFKITLNFSGQSSKAQPSEKYKKKIKPFSVSVNAEKGQNLKNAVLVMPTFQTIKGVDGQNFKTLETTKQKKNNNTRQYSDRQIRSGGTAISRDTTTTDTSGSKVMQASSETPSDTDVEAPPEITYQACTPQQDGDTVVQYQKKILTDANGVTTESACEATDIRMPITKDYATAASECSKKYHLDATNRVYYKVYNETAEVDGESVTFNTCIVDNVAQEINVIKDYSLAASSCTAKHEIDIEKSIYYKIYTETAEVEGDSLTFDTCIVERDVPIATSLQRDYNFTGCNFLMDYMNNKVWLRYVTFVEIDDERIDVIACQSENQQRIAEQDNTNCTLRHDFIKKESYEQFIWYYRDTENNRVQLNSDCIDTVKEHYIYRHVMTEDGCTRDVDDSSQVVTIFTRVQITDQLGNRHFASDCEPSDKTAIVEEILVVDNKLTDGKLNEEAFSHGNGQSRRMVNLVYRDYHNNGIIHDTVASTNPDLVYQHNWYNCDNQYVHNDNLLISYIKQRKGFWVAGKFVEIEACQQHGTNSVAHVSTHVIYKYHETMKNAMSYNITARRDEDENTHWTEEFFNIFGAKYIKYIENRLSNTDYINVRPDGSTYQSSQSAYHKSLPGQLTHKQINLKDYVHYNYSWRYGQNVINHLKGMVKKDYRYTNLGTVYYNVSICGSKKCQIKLP